MNNECVLYDKLKDLILSQNELEQYEYPISDPLNPSVCKVKFALKSQLGTRQVCKRCKMCYQVDSEGIPVGGRDCSYHRGPFFRETMRYRDCQCSANSPACVVGKYHVHDGERELFNYSNFVETKPKLDREPNKHGIFALDCEMAQTTHGLNLTKVCVVNHLEQTVYSTLVKPEKRVLDYNTIYSGIKAEDLQNCTKTLADVQRDLLELFSSKSILIGHSLHHDMLALKLFHKTYIDTTKLYPHPRGMPRRLPLKELVNTHLAGRMHQADGDKCVNDAIVALRLVLRKLSY